MKHHGWSFDELAHAGEEHLDSEFVAAYERKAGVDPTDDLVLLRDLGLDKTRTFVELGAGTGTFALSVAPFVGRVVTVDVSPAMCASLGKKAQQMGLEHVECVQGSFLTYEHRGNLADFVYSRNALHHLPDFWKALALERIAAILRPNGVLRLRDISFSFDPAEAGRVIEEWLTSAPERSQNGWTRPELETHLRDEHSTFSWLLEPKLDRAGFQVLEATHSASRTYSAYICSKVR